MNNIETGTAAVTNVDFASLLGDPASNPVAASPLEKAMAVITPEEAIKEDPATAEFSFRSLLSEQHREALSASAPAAADRMLKDYNAILQFGAPVLQRLNDSSSALLRAQRDIKIPEAEQVVNELLRAMDGYEKKYQNQKLEDFSSRLKKWFKGTAYSFKTMVREAKPLEEKINLAEVKLQEMELRLADNVSRGQQLHRDTLETLEGTVAVLAALEEILDYSRGVFGELDELLRRAESEATNGLAVVMWRGEELSLSDLRERHAQVAGGISELEKTWADWRTQYFLGYSQAPTTRNLILVSSTMQRRCHALRTMGLPSARRSLVLWGQAVLAREGAEMGMAVQEGTDRLVQSSMEAAADAVEVVARASQTPIISEETIFSVIDSVKRQCEGLVAADRWGRDVRAKNLQVMEAGEKQIDAVGVEARRQLVAATLGAAAEPVPTAPLPEADILRDLGVK